MSTQIAIRNPDNSALATLPQISHALAMIKTIPDVKDLRDKAAAICRYAKESKQSLEIQNRAAYVKLLCERKAGELLLDAPRSSGGPGGRGSQRKASASLAEALRQANIPESTARRWQYLAQWPEEFLIALLEVCNEDDEELTTTAAITSAKGYLDSIKKPKEKDPEKTDSAKTESGPADRPNDSNQTTPQNKDAGDTASASIVIQERKEGNASNRPAVDRKRIARLVQLFDAALELCEGVSELDELAREIAKCHFQLNHLEVQK